MDTNVPIIKSSGVTPTERLLQSLCDHSFLGMWSYPGVFRDQGKGNTGDGKEVCDLLVVFGNEVIIFSDKSCLFPADSEIQVTWKRWFRRSIWESARQAWGAERWIRQYPDRLFLDKSCTQRFPLDLPKVEDMRFHHVVVAHGLKENKRAGTSDDGSLKIDSRLVGKDAHDPPIGPCLPFTVGWLDPTNSFVHVLGGDSLNIVLSKLDTIRDFTAYLSRKEQIFREGHPVTSSSEQDLLAIYLRQLNDKDEHDFVFQGRPGPLSVLVGEWMRFESSFERQLQIKADQISKGWDWLIENFTKHIFSGTAFYSSHTNQFSVREKAFRVMASEGRVRRRLLATCLMEMMEELGTAPSRVRVMVPTEPLDPHYVFLLMRPRNQEHYDAYRKRRAGILNAYCMVTKIRFPEAKEIVGLAMEPFDCPESSQDALYLDISKWTPEAQADAELLRANLNLLEKSSIGRTTVNEYPSNSLEFLDF